MGLKEIANDSETSIFIQSTEPSRDGGFDKDAIWIDTSQDHPMHKYHTGSDWQPYWVAENKPNK